MDTLIEHAGVIQAISDGKATILVETGGCGGCSHQSGCGLGRLAGERSSTVMTLPVEAAFQPGDQVVLSLPENRMVAASLLAYLVPSILLLLGAGIAYNVFASDGATALGAIGGLLAGILLTRALPDWVPVPTVRRVIPAAHTVHWQPGMEFTKNKFIA